MSLYRFRYVRVAAAAALLLLTLSITALAAPPDTFVTPLTIGGDWIVDFWDTDGAGTAANPSYEIADAPVALAGYGKSALNMKPGDGVGGSGCSRIGGKTFFGTQTLDGVALDDIDEFTFSYLVETLAYSHPNPINVRDNANLSPYINIFVERNGTAGFQTGGSGDTILIYEPLYTRGNNFVVEDTWYTDTPIGAGSMGVWHTAGVGITGVGPANSGNPTWAQIMELDADTVTSGIQRVGDLTIVNPTAGCDEGTGSGFVIAIGQKNGEGFAGMSVFVDGVILEVDGDSQDVNVTLSQSFTLTGGDAQTGEIGFVFGEPLSVSLFDTNGSPIEGETVVFTAHPSAGASATFPGGNTVVTNANGFASAVVVADGAAGAYTVTAEADGRMVTFALTNSTGTAFTDELVLPQNINSGEFWVTDKYNNVPANDAFVFGAIAANPAGVALPGYGKSSFQFNTGPGVDSSGQTGCARTGGKVFLGTTELAGVALKDIKGLSYSFLFADTSIDFNYGAFVNIYVDLNGNGTWEAGAGNDAILVYDPAQQSPAPGTRTANTWYDTVAIAPHSTGRWASSVNSFAGIPNISPAPTGSTWNEILAKPYGAGTVGDLKVVNPTAGCDDGGVADDEGTGTGFNIQFGQKNGGSYNNGEQHVDKVGLYVDGEVSPTTFDFALFGAPASIDIISGGGQSQDVGFVFDDAVIVEVKDIYGNLVQEATVTFTAPGSGASATLSASALTGVDGRASTGAITANLVAGTYNVSVAAGSVSASFSLTNTTPVAAVKTIVYPEDIGSFWVVDYFDQNTSGDTNPMGVITNNPVGSVNAPAGYNNGSFQLTNGNGIGDPGAPGGCDRLGGKVFLGTTQLNGVALKDIKSLSYSFLVESSPNLAARPYVNIFVDLNNNGGAWEPGIDGILIYETIYGDNQPGASINLNQWYSTVAIGPLSVGDWHTASPAFGGIGQFTPSAPISSWNEILAAPYGLHGVENVGDLKIVNPVAGCNDTTATEGTGSGFVLVTGQKSGDGWTNADQHVDKVDLYVEGVVTPTVYDFALYGDPTKIIKISGDNQTTAVSTPFATPLTIQVLDAEDKPIEGLTVQFAVLTRAASATFTPANGQTVTNANGEASISAIADDQVGSYEVIVTAGPVFAAFNLTNAPASVTAPVLSAAATGATTVNVTWTNTLTSFDTLNLLRSADGVTFTSIATPSNSTFSYADSGLLCGSTHHYRLDVTNLAGTASSNIATVTTNDCAELLQNGSFEAPLAGTWTGANTTGDKRKVDAANAYEGAAMLLFKGSAAENSSFKQVVSNISVLTAGDTLYMTAAFKSTFATPILRTQLVINNSTGKVKVPMLAFLAPSAAYTQGSAAYVLTEAPTKVVVKIAHKSKGGKSYLDMISLTVNDLGSRGAEGRDSVLPPPTAPDNFRGNN